MTAGWAAFLIESRLLISSKTRLFLCSDRFSVHAAIPEYLPKTHLPPNGVLPLLL